jgi:hypothetical protein
MWNHLRESLGHIRTVRIAQSLADEWTYRWSKWEFLRVERPDGFDPFIEMVRAWAAKKCLRGIYNKPSSL